MNTYLIPVTESYGYNYDYLALVHAQNSQQAYQLAKTIPDIYLYDHMVCNDEKQYQIYTSELYIPKQFFPISQKNDIMTISFKNTKGYEHMAFFNVNWNDYTETLSKIAAPETWSNDTYPNNGILANYIVKTYEKLQSERNIIFEQNYALFNTGLFTKYYEPIYAYHSEQDILFLTEYDLGKRGIVKYPERANYFDHPELLLFDWHYKINIYYKHILEDNKSRMNIPEDILNSHNLLNTFNGAIDTMKKKVSSNYKLAIPQYFEGKVQLLLPLCLHSDDIPDLALVVTKIGDVYQGHTCLTLDMAYNNARLIAKPESNWLNP